MSVALITGGTGFLGAHLVTRLLKSGWDVIAIKRTTSIIPTGLVDDKRIRWLDVETWETVESELTATPVIDAVFHLATVYGRTDESSSMTVAANIIFPLRLLELALRKEVPLFISTDSCFTLDYGYAQAYTLSKKQFGSWGKLLASQSKIRFVTLELQHPFGPGDRPGKFVPFIIGQCCKDGITVPLTTGEQRKDFIYVDDVIDAYVLVAERSAELAAGYHHFECGRGEGVRLRDFVESIHRACKSNCTLGFGELEYRDREIMYSAANLQKLNELGWSPRWSLDDGIAVCVDAYRNLQAAPKK